jgi:hypothetical protein
MKQLILNFTRTFVVPLLLMFGLTTIGYGQSVTMFTSNCTATANEFQFDVSVTNNGPGTLQFNNTVIRLTHSAAILALGTNTIVFSYVGGSDFPLSWPPNSFPAFTYNSGSRLFGVSTSTGVYLNGTTCAAPNIATGETKKLGRFSLKNTAQDFVPGADVGLAWGSSGIVAYINCAQGSTAFNVVSGNTTLNAPCSLSIPVPCSSPTVNSNPTNQTTCTSGTTTFTGSFTGGTPVPTLLWQVQTGGVGLFSDLTETAPYSGTATGTLTITTPNISLSTNRYRLKANNSCGDVFTNDALLTVTATPNAGTVTGVSPLCISNTTTYNNNGDPGGTWSSTNTAVATVNAAGVVSTLNAGTSDITYTVISGCTVSSFQTITVNPFTSLAGSAGGSQVCNSTNVQPIGTSFSDPSCNLINTVLPSGASPVSGIVNSCVIVDDVVHTYHSIPYVQRHYDIIPAVNPANSTATVTLYFTQGEFDAFNASRGVYPALPTGSGDGIGKANLLVTQFHGTGTYPGNYNGGNSTLINPDDNNIVWDVPANRWKVTFDVNGFSGFYLFTSLDNTPLPINLLNFSGRNNGNNNLLEWATSSEQNSSYFELQRSTDGINYVKAGKINAAGNSNIIKSYNYNDDITSINRNLYYYRLKLVDNSGNYKNSATVKIRLNSKGFIVEASPNPFQDQLRINVETSLQEIATISLKDLSGRKLLQTESLLRKGNNAIPISSLNNIPAGVYFLTITTDTQQETVKVVKK